MKTGCVYLIRNLKNGKVYVGQTRNDYLGRWRGHLRAALRGSPHPLYKAIRKYGQSSFSIEVLWRGSVGALDRTERLFIAEYDSLIDFGKGYNLTSGGASYKASRRTKAKMAKIHKQIWQRPGYAEKMGQIRRLTWNDPSCRAHILTSMRIAARDFKTKEKRRLSNIEAAANPEFRKKISALSKASWKRTEYRDLITQKRRDKAADPAYRLKMSVACKGIKRSEETRRRISAGLKDALALRSSGWGHPWRLEDLEVA